MSHIMLSWYLDKGNNINNIKNLRYLKPSDYFTPVILKTQIILNFRKKKIKNKEEGDILFYKTTILFSLSMNCNVKKIMHSRKVGFKRIGNLFVKNTHSSIIFFSRELYYFILRFISYLYGFSIDSKVLLWFNFYKIQIFWKNLFYLKNIPRRMTTPGKDEGMFWEERIYQDFFSNCIVQTLVFMNKKIFIGILTLIKWNIVHKIRKKNPSQNIKGTDTKQTTDRDVKI